MSSNLLRIGEVIMAVPYRKILLPLDGSPLAAQVLTQLPWLATPGATALILVSAIEDWRYAMPSQEYVMHDLLAGLWQSAAQYLHEVGQQFHQLGYTVSTHLADGQPAQVILEAAKTEGADLIALCTHGRSGLARWALGSVAERVLQGATVPIFLVRAGAPVTTQKLQRILLPLDGSAIAEAALPQAQALARANDAQIILLHVIQRLDERSRSLLFRNEEAAQAFFAEWRGGTERYLELIIARLAKVGVHAESHVVVATPAQAIGDLARREQIDLVVMGTHGRSGLNRWVYGSVANQVLRGAETPLLLVRTLA